MTPYPLAPLMRLRIFRQDKAMRQLQVCERKLVEARHALSAARKNHETFLNWLVKEEEDRYAAILNTLMSLEDVADFKAGLLEIRARESYYLEEILKAQNGVTKCEAARDKAREDLLAAQKGTLKIEVHREKWQEILTLEIQRAEDLEMEDFTPVKELFAQE